MSESHHANHARKQSSASSVSSETSHEAPSIDPEYYTRLTREVHFSGSPVPASPQSHFQHLHKKTTSRSSSFNQQINALQFSTMTTQTQVVHPPIRNLDELDEYIRNDPSSLVQLMPEILRVFEKYIVSHPSSALPLWDQLLPILRTIVAPSARSWTKTEVAEPECETHEEKWINVHGEEWSDEFKWLKDRENQVVLDYVAAENEYSRKSMAHTRPLQRLLYKEFVSRLDESEESARARMGNYTYYCRKVAGQEYRQHVRIDEDGVEDVYMDENELFGRAEFDDASCLNLGFIRHSPDGSTVAYGIDSNGSERYTVYFMRLDTKEVLQDRIEDVYEFLEWSNEGQNVYYLLLDDCERAYKLMRHRIGNAPSQDTLLYHEEDESFYLSLSITCNGQYIILNSAAQITSETRYISADNPSAEPQLLFPRRENINYIIEHHRDHFYILTNENSKNNWIYRVSVPENDQVSWEDTLAKRETVIAHRDFVLIEDFALRRNHLAVFERSNCLQNVRIIDLREGNFQTYHYISFSDPVYSLWPGSVSDEIGNLMRVKQFETDTLRFTFSSLVTPKQVVEYHMDTREMTVVHEEAVQGLIPYTPEFYVQKRLYATGTDGTSIPLSIVYRSDLVLLNGKNPCLLHSYGAYGSSMNPIFSKVRLSLLDRGFVFAIAHVRGGADMGNGWYEEGKLDKKPNTFLDFISCAEYLCKEGYTSPEKLSIYGRSAGGLLIGASVTMRPDLFKAALMEVPFVDVVNTMFNPNIPWTAFEYEEWGNPEDFAIYEKMKSYCPYTQLKRLGPSLASGEFPDLLVVGGMNDPRVAFFEPLKFVARTRNERRKAKKTMTDGELQHQSGTTRRSASTLPTPKRDSLILLRVDDVGHGGSSGQYSYLEDLAFEYAFLIDRLGASFRPIIPGQGEAIGRDPYGFGYATPGGALKLDFESAEVAEKEDEDEETFNAIGDIRPSSGKSDKRDSHVVRVAGEEKEYRSSKKGDRRPNRIYQWLSNMF